ncbi:hypothetical protein ACQ4M3_36295 [Leptolyngbya sp. AN03gr2]|uniref:hypothetical protein n=1 Tax=unclassified Leptolyngbya TaxID=2650499 RepID=UPI003D31305D
MIRFWRLGFGLVTLFGWSDPAIAQVVPDQTLPVGERSQISGDPSIQIDGSATRGNTLFHSFQSRQAVVPRSTSAEG